MISSSFDVLGTPHRTPYNVHFLKKKLNFMFLLLLRLGFVAPCTTDTDHLVRGPTVTISHDEFKIDGTHFFRDFTNHTCSS